MLIVSLEACADERHDRIGAAWRRIEDPREEREHQGTAHPFEHCGEEPGGRDSAPAQPLARREHREAAHHISKHPCPDYAPARHDQATPGIIEG